MKTLHSQIVMAAFLSFASLNQAQVAEHKSHSDASSVTYFPSSEVNAGFAKSAVLFDGSDKYMVHASRREQPGMAEIHTKDADIVYVLEGTASLVTGGMPVKRKANGPG